VALGLAAVVVVLAAASTDNPAAGATERDLDGWTALLLVIAGLFLVGSRRFPGSAALAVLGVSFVWYGVGYTNGLINVATLIAFYGLGTSEGERRRFAVVGVAVAALLVGMVAFGDESLPSGLTAAGYIMMAVLFGEFVRNRRLLVDHLAERAERAEADAERRVVDERLRIARDVHDMLAHTVSAMTVQAEVAADALDRDGDAVRAAVQAIRQAGAEALGDVRATVAVLRSGVDPTGPAPAPRIADIDGLVDTAREQGLDVARHRPAHSAGAGDGGAGVPGRAGGDHERGAPRRRPVGAGDGLRGGFGVGGRGARRRARPRRRGQRRLRPSGHGRACGVDRR
jgi:hypothetical protein